MATWTFPYDPSITFDYMPEGHETLIAHVNIKLRPVEDNPGASIYEALLYLRRRPGSLDEWKLAAGNIVDRDRDRRRLREALEKQHAILAPIGCWRPGVYKLFSNWRLCIRRGYQRLEFYI